MQRRIIFILATLVLLLGAALIFLFLRGQPRAVPVTIEAADENAMNPYQEEMDCVDRLLHNNNLNANEVEPALARCQGGADRNQSQ